MIKYSIVCPVEKETPDLSWIKGEVTKLEKSLGVTFCPYAVGIVADGLLREYKGIPQLYFGAQPDVMEMQSNAEHWFAQVEVSEEDAGKIGHSNAKGAFTIFKVNTRNDLKKIFNLPD